MRDPMTVWCDLCSAMPGRPCRAIAGEPSDKAEDLASGRAFHRRRQTRAVGGATDARMTSPAESTDA